MPTRRELLLGISATSLVPDSTVRLVTLAVLLEELRARARAEIPDLKEIKVRYDPQDEKVPLMVIGMKI